MLKLFDEMLDAWGAKWTAQLGGKNVGKVLKSWTESLCDLTEEQIYNAFTMLKNIDAFPPAISDFRRKALGIVSAGEAYILALNDEDSLHRKLLPSWDWGHASEMDCRRKFKAVYATYEEQMLTRCVRSEINANELLVDKSTATLAGAKKLDIV